MHYYKKNIGDYHKKAGRLTMLEHGAYTLLLDACYDRERFPTLDEALDWCWARSDEEVAAVKFVLSKFFTVKDQVYTQARVQEELDAYRIKAEKNQRIAIDREASRRTNGDRESTNRARTVHEPSPNQEPLTKNQEPDLNIGRQADRFTEFFAAYPKKVKKKPAHDIWKRKNLNPKADQIIQDVAMRLSSDRRWLDGFVPDPTTYLNQERWTDEIQRGEHAKTQQLRDTRTPLEKWQAKYDAGQLD